MANRAKEIKALHPFLKAITKVASEWGWTLGDVLKALEIVWRRHHEHTEPKGTTDEQQ